MVQSQERDALNAQKQHDEAVSKLRQEGAARMREAALSRHQLLQQVEALTANNCSSDTALVSQSKSLSGAGGGREGADSFPRLLGRYMLHFSTVPSLTLYTCCYRQERR